MDTLANAFQKKEAGYFYKEVLPMSTSFGVVSLIPVGINVMLWIGSGQTGIHLLVSF